MKERYGQGIGGTTATFLPLRIPPASCTKRPIAIAWSTAYHLHFVPVVEISGQQYDWSNIPVVACIDDVSVVLRIVFS